MKRTALALTLVATLLFLAVDQTLFVNLANANFWYRENILPPSGTKQPIISILSPNNNSVYAKDSFRLTFDVTTNKSWEYQYSGDTGPWEYLFEVYYTLDWTEGNISVYSMEQMQTMKSNLSYSETLTQVPDGKHEINVSAIAIGHFINGKPVPELTEYFYNITGFSSIILTVDTSPPNISILSSHNGTYFNRDVPLEFTTDEPVSSVSYVLDGQANATISGNATLIGLPSGEHNVTIYARDEAGNMGASETVFFNVAKPEPFPTTLVITASGASIAVVGVGLLVYFKKRKR